MTSSMEVQSIADCENNIRIIQGMGICGETYQVGGREGTI